MGVFMRLDKEKLFTNIKKIIINFTQIIIGTIIMAVSIDLFLLPNQLSVGGFSGIGTIGYYIFNMPVGTTVFILNIPLFVLVLFKNGKKFFLEALVGTLSLSYFLNLFDNFKGLTDSAFLGCIYGGILSGIGTAIVLNANASTGGTDLFAQLIKTYFPNIKTGNVIIIFDTIIVVISTIVFKEIEIGLYSAIAIYIMGKVLDVFFEGIDFAKMLIIISPKYMEISNEINDKVKRGTTAIYGKGMYTQDETNLILCVASRKEVGLIRKIIKKKKKKAFLIITNAREVYGNGFKK